MSPGLERPPAWAIAALVLGLIAIGIMTPLAMRRGVVPADVIAAARASESAAAVASAAARTAAAAAQAARVDIAALGDGYTAGSAMDSGERSEWPALLGATHPWDVTRFAAGGTGFIAGRDTGTDFAARVPGIIAAKPDVVVVEGGHDDAGSPPAEVEAAARAVMTDLRAGLPDAKIVVLGVLWPDSAPGPVFAIDDSLQAVTAEIGGVFVDALRDGWFSGGNRRLIGSDGTNPTDEGHAALAQRIGDALSAAGVPATV
jgi:lysophospholipase L1-like esterase